MRGGSSSAAAAAAPLSDVAQPSATDELPTSVVDVDAEPNVKAKKPPPPTGTTCKLSYLLLILSCSSKAGQTRTESGGGSAAIYAIEAVGDRRRNGKAIESESAGACTTRSS